MDYEIMMNGNVKIGERAPDFEAVTTMGNISLNNYSGKWVVLFSHPGDFTPVCTTEIISFARSNTYFNRLNTCLIGLSVDSLYSHLAWVYDIYRRTGIKVPFPIIADRNGEIARKYGMISNNVSTTETVRNVYIIDDKGIIRLILVYPMNVGRSIPEIIRSVQALQIADENDSSTPANWVPCEPLIIPPPQTLDNIIERKIDNWYDLIDEIVLDPWVTRNQERAVKSFLSQLAHQQNQKTICCWKSHLNDYPRYLVPTLNI